MARIYKRQVRLTSAEEKKVNVFLKANPVFEENFSLLARVALASFWENPSLSLKKVIILDEYLLKRSERKKQSAQIKALFGKKPLSRKPRDPLKAKLLKELYGER